MSITRSDNRFEKHPKPVQEFERKQVAGVYVDWDDATEVVNAVPAPYRPNKYFWIAGIYYQCDSDGTTFRAIGGGGIGGAVKMLKFLINADGSGSPGPNFDGYKAAGNELHDSRMVNGKLLYVIMQGAIYQDYAPEPPGDPSAVIPVSLIQIPGDAYIDFTNIGGTQEGMWVIIVYQQ